MYSFRGCGHGYYLLVDQSLEQESCLRRIWSSLRGSMTSGEAGGEGAQSAPEVSVTSNNRAG